ncbi:MAG: hypothetical protein JWM82_167 [Myxococcales bacterium]|nr:hypothetical protein [Myxococcales bacterium]
MRLSFAWVGLLLCASCSGANQAVKPDDMSAAQHRQEATQERQLAGVERNKYRPEDDRPIAGGKGDTDAATNPTEGHLVAAAQYEKHARQHEAAARALEKFEQNECEKIPSATRAACPLLGPVRRFDDIPGGVRVTLVPGSPVDAIVAHMRCHYAFARARGFSENVTCPLYIEGIEIKRGSGPDAIELVSSDPSVQQTVRARAREEIGLAKPTAGP